MESTDELMAKAEAGTVTHEELVDVMMRGSAKYGRPTPPREVLLAQVRERHPTCAEVSAFVRMSFGLYQQAMLAAMPPKGRA